MAHAPWHSTITSSSAKGPTPGLRCGEKRGGGDRGEVVDRDRDFVKLRVVNGLEGWTLSAGVGLIDLDHRVH